MTVGTGADTGWDAEGYARHARFVAVLGEPLLDLLAVKPGEAVLDLGCGDGALTEKLVARGARVTGIDASPEMVAAARRRGVDAQVMDGHDLAFESAFDVVFSNAALHWMLRPDAVLTGVFRALRPGGRFVGELGGAGNVARIVAAVTTVHQRRFGRPADLPWYFPTEADYAGRLRAAGFTVTAITLFARPTPLPTGVAGWLETFGRSFLRDVGYAAWPAFVAEVEETLGDSLKGPDGIWYADYVRLRFAAARPQ